jgi:hypothetical protein
LAGHDTYGQLMSGKIVISGVCQSIVPLGRQLKRYFARNDDDGFWRFPDPFCKSPDFPYTLEHIIVDIDDFFNRDDVCWKSRCINPDESIDYGSAEYQEAIQQYTLEQLGISSKAFYLQIAKWSVGPAIYALMLEPRDESGEYRRIGVAQIPEVNGLAQRDWEMRTVTII